MRTFRQFVGDEWRGLSEGLAEDHRIASAERRARWAPYGGASRYYLSGTWKASIILFVAAMLGLVTTLVLRIAFATLDAPGAWAMATFVWVGPVILASGAGRHHPIGTRDLSTGPMLKNLFWYSPLKVGAYAWAAFWIALLLFGGVGLLIFGLRYV